MDVLLRLAGTFEVATNYTSLSGCEWRRRPVNDSILCHPIPSHPHDTHTHQGTEKLPIHSFLG